MIQKAACGLPSGIFHGDASKGVVETLRKDVEDVDDEKSVLRELAVVHALMSMI